MVNARSKLTYPSRSKDFAIGTLPRSVAARIRSTPSAASTRVPSARRSSMYPWPRRAGSTPMYAMIAW